MREPTYKLIQCTPTQSNAITISQPYIKAVWYLSILSCDIPHTMHPPCSTQKVVNCMNLLSYTSIVAQTECIASNNDFSCKRPGKREGCIVIDTHSSPGGLTCHQQKFEVNDRALIHFSLIHLSFGDDAHRRAHLGRCCMLTSPSGEDQRRSD